MVCIRGETIPVFARRIPASIPSRGTPGEGEAGGLLPPSRKPPPQPSPGVPGEGEEGEILPPATKAVATALIAALQSVQPNEVLRLWDPLVQKSSPPFWPPRHARFWGRPLGPRRHLYLSRM